MAVLMAWREIDRNVRVREIHDHKCKLYDAGYRAGILCFFPTDVLHVGWYAATLGAHAA